MPFSASRFIRYFTAVVCSLFASGMLIYACNQTRFQNFLHTHYITWDDFPAPYSAILKSKDWETLESGKFDYSRYFPPTSTSSTINNIPATIHFIWFKDLYASAPGTTDMPSTGSHSPALCQKHNPGYNVTVWDAIAGRQLLEEHYPWFTPTYDAYKFPIQRIDALKYFLLWHFGGVYMDMDISCRRPLDPLLNFPAWFPEASPLGVNNDLMAARPRHPVIGLMLESLENHNRNLIFPYLTIFWSTGPQFAGDILKESFLDTGSPSNSSGDWFVLPQQFYSEEYTFFGHSPGGTWHGEDVAFVLWLVAHPIPSYFVLAVVLGSCIEFACRRRRMRTLGNRRVHFEEVEENEY